MCPRRLRFCGARQQCCTIGLLQAGPGSDAGGQVANLATRARTAFQGKPIGGVSTIIGHYLQIESSGSQTSLSFHSVATNAIQTDGDASLVLAPAHQIGVFCAALDARKQGTTGLQVALTGSKHQVLGPFRSVILGKRGFFRRRGKRGGHLPSETPGREGTNRVTLAVWRSAYPVRHARCRSGGGFIADRSSSVRCGHGRKTIAACRWQYR